MVDEIHPSLIRGEIVKHTRLRQALVCGIFLLAFAFHAGAQQATIVGTVADPTGAVVPNVVIRATLTSTGESFSTTSNTAGQYVIPSLGNGSYDIKAEATGFKVFEEKGIVLTVGDRARVDISLQVGATNQNVT